MRPRATHALALILAASVAAAGFVIALTQSAAGPHDGPAAPDPAAYWLPRNREALTRQRHAYPVATAPIHTRAKLKFRNAKRVSSDVLAAPPASLPTAQAETQTEPWVAVNPEDPDHMIAGWQETRFTDGGARSLGVAVSTNGGRKWKDALLPGLTIADGGTWNRASDPWPTFGPDGVVYYNSLLVAGTIPGDNAIGISVSRDGGTTWSDPVEINRDSLDFNDKNSMIADTHAGSPHRGNAYIGWDVNVWRNGGFVGQRMVVSRSLDEGATWSNPRKLIEDSTNIGIVMRVGPDGTVYAIWAGAASGDANLGLRFAESTNGGRTFSDPVKIADYLATGAAGFRSGAILPSLDIDPNTGDLYAAWPDARFTGVDQAALIVSRDGGDSWTDPAQISDGPSQTPAMTVGVAVNGAGEVVVGYYTARNDATTPTTVDYYLNRSTDGAATFEEGVRVTRKSFDATAAARAGGSLSIFLGDYVGLAGTDDGFLALFTAATKGSKLGPGKQPDIFGAVTR